MLEQNLTGDSTATPAMGGLVMRALQRIAGAMRPNPYPYYRLLRRIRPIMWVPPRFWIVTSHAEAEAILRDRRFLEPDPSFSVLLPVQGAVEFVQDQFRRSLITANPPDHTRLRKLMARAFSAPAIDRLRPRIQAIADELLEEMWGKRDLDLISEFTYPLPINVIAEMLGVPAGDRNMFRGWSDVLVGMIEPIKEIETAERMKRTMEEFSSYFSKLVDDRRERSENDVLSAMVAAEADGTRLKADELMPNLTMLLVAGHETTTNLIGNGVLSLLRNPDELAKLRADPTLIPTAVEELLRFESPIQVAARAVSESAVISGRTFRPGDVALVMIGAANRDPARFTNPERLDVTRSENGHLAFGGGIHYCLGAHLARLEGEIAFSTLVQRAPKLALRCDRALWRESINLRALRELPVAL